MIEGEHLEIAVTDPVFPHGGIGEVMRLDRKPGTKTQREQDINDPSGGVGGQFHNEIQVHGQAGVTLQDDGHAGRARLGREQEPPRTRLSPRAAAGGRVGRGG